MNNFFAYLFEVSVCIGVWYLLYWSLLRRTTFFVLNRYYLVMTLVLSFVIPLLEITDTGLRHQISEYIYHVEDAGVLAPEIHEDGVVQVLEFGVPAIERYGTILYIVVAAFLGVRLVRNVAALVYERSGSYEMLDGLRVVRTKHSNPFSFFDTVFLPKGSKDQSVFDHERVHIEQQHWIDLVIVELAVVILWMNPLLIFVRRSIKLQHEYHADDVAFAESPSPEIYLSCLLAQFGPVNVPGPASQFFSNNLKHRIIMLTKKNSPRPMALVYALAVPLCVFLLTAFSVGEDRTLVPSSAITLVVDAAHGGTDTGASSSGVSEKTITLAVAKQVQILGKELGVNVLLTRDGDHNLSLADRTNFSRRNNADVFLSLHMNVDPSDPETNGINCMIAANERNTEVQRLAESLNDQLQRVTGMSFRGTKTGNPYVLKNNAAPAAIIELGYLSNSNDLNFMKDDRNQRTIASEILKSVIAFKKD